MKIVDNRNERYGRVSIYPFADPDVPEERLFLVGSIDVTFDGHIVINFSGRAMTLVETARVQAALAVTVQYSAEIQNDNAVKMEAENRRFRKALYWYSDSNNYTSALYDIDVPVAMDFGERAETALSGEDADYLYSKSPKKDEPKCAE